MAKGGKGLTHGSNQRTESSESNRAAQYGLKAQMAGASVAAVIFFTRPPVPGSLFWLPEGVVLKRI